MASYTGAPTEADEGDLSDALFSRFSDLLLATTGIQLKEHKKYLVVNRLSRIIGPGRAFADYNSYYQALSLSPKGPLMAEFVNALTTNYSYFFRDPVHFQLLESYIRERGRGEDYLRFWSAAASTGEEAFSMAITLLRNRDCLPKDCRILATDISTQVLAKAEEGIYPSARISSNIAPADLQRFFKPTKDPERLQVVAEARALVAFRYLNLLSVYPLSKLMDIIFLRNVLIYFGPEEKTLVLRRMYEHLKPGGFLVVGLSESLVGFNHPFVMCKNSVYRKDA